MLFSTDSFKSFKSIVCVNPEETIILCEDQQSKSINKEEVNNDTFLSLSKYCVLCQVEVLLNNSTSYKNILKDFTYTTFTHYSEMIAKVLEKSSTDIQFKVRIITNYIISLILNISYRYFRTII